MSDELLRAVEVALARAEVWDDPRPGLEDDIVAAIRAEPVALDGVRARRERRRIPAWLITAAAVAVLAVGAVVVVRAAGDNEEVASDTTEASLAGTDLAPDATATAFFTPTPAGLKILLDADGLAGADPGHMYEAWISDGEIRVSAGTFHLRDGHNPIELWAGTDDPRFHVITVTLEPIDGVADSSGQVVLKGEFSLPGAADSDGDSGQYEPD
jgi:Anti-sigma-K factor rskA, C-terminal